MDKRNFLKLLPGLCTLSAVPYKKRKFIYHTLKKEWIEFDRISGHYFAGHGGIYYIFEHRNVPVCFHDVHLKAEIREI